jgi:8-oxo-dGTP diphosphatase
LTVLGVVRVIDGSVRVDGDNSEGAFTEIAASAERSEAPASLSTKTAIPSYVSTTPPPTRVTVVAAALIAGGHLLAARRRSPPSLAGHWELPGGKVEPHENDATALARELREELAIYATIGPVLGRTSINPTTTLTIYLCTHFNGVPTLGDDHDELRWVHADNLTDLNWLEADRLLLPVLIAHLTPSP